ncbi:hypothetical protein K6V90_25805 [Cupriavidus pauculus]|uniref:hypothetical protein n=1 Tax=Cupriavidus pauculus TaxID=82633 RepID=UPI001C93388A|nr:hypothetical protein [Cupriavidus pauculus]MBY4733959.1 hypothetical protein [Cupriavidus pauculus]
MTDTTKQRADLAAAERVLQGVLRRAGDIDDFEQGLMRDACMAYHADPAKRQKVNDAAAGNGDGMVLTDEQILTIGRKHFRGGHDPKAEPAFVAAVRECLAAPAAPARDGVRLQRFAPSNRHEDGMVPHPDGDYVLFADVATPAAPVPKCASCNDNGMIGGPSYYAPDEGGVPCPDCAAPADAASEAMSQAVRDVLAERQRQISGEGWTPEHDDKFTNGALSLAAGTYALHGPLPTHGNVPLTWPWDHEGWKPSTPRRNLVKAGALILAEIERLDRAAASPALLKQGR